MPESPSYVYLLTEDTFDDQVFLYLLEWLRGGRFEPIPMRLRVGGGVGEVRKKLKLMLSHIRQTGRTDRTHFVFAVDNDRVPVHPSHEITTTSKRGECRHCASERALRECLPDGLPIPGAFAVPVEMIESWLLLMDDAATLEAGLPKCARREQAMAKEIYGATPPPQLKDRFDEIQARTGLTSRDDAALDCILRLDSESLANRSPSFARFRDMVAAWP